MARTKGVTVVPTEDAYLLQAHQISRSAYTMDTVPRRLLHLILCQVQFRGEDDFELLEMTQGDVLRALEMTDDRGREIRDATKELLNQVVDIDTDDGWVQFHWVEVARYIKSRKVIQFRVSSELVPYVLQVKEMFSIIPITSMNRLRGRALHLFEMVMSKKGMAGTGGNKRGEWFYDLAFDEIRFLFKIGAGEYKQTTDLRKWVIDAPVKEINEAGVGLSITADYTRFKVGRRVTGVRLWAKLATIGSKSEPRNVTPTPDEQAEERQNAALKSAHPIRYAELLHEARSQKWMPGLAPADPDFWAEAEAIARLKAELKSSGNKK